MEYQNESYLDIETTGLSPGYCHITVIGIHRCKGLETQFIQLVGDKITDISLMDALEGTDILYTYNGSRFDLPFIHGSLGINLTDTFHHHDLMYDCWRCNLKGGFKAVEQQLGISRQLQGINGWDAVLLWQRYQDYSDKKALATLLKYNEEDVVNLKVLRGKLEETWLEK